MKYALIGNSGSNHNYIGLTLSNSNIDNRLTYHNLGTHGNAFKDISYSTHNEIEKIIKEDDFTLLVCFASKWNNDTFKLIKKHNIKIIQILIEKNQECLLINWQEKLRINFENDDDQLSKDWEEQMKVAWQNYTKFPIERAIVQWTYKLYNKEFIDVKKTPYADSFFLFGSLYDSYKQAEIEFKKFDIEYSEDEYNKWKASQKTVFDSWTTIKDNLKTPKNLKVDYQRGIAFALQGIKEEINEEQCWQKFKHKLD